MSERHEVMIPTLIIHGENDGLVPVSWAHGANALTPGSELHVLADCGHWPPREKRGEFNRSVSGFLA